MTRIQKIKQNIAATKARIAAGEDTPTGELHIVKGQRVPAMKLASHLNLLLRVLNRETAAAMLADPESVGVMGGWGMDSDFISNSSQG
tara:strand:- start:1174 stop:1437 length:264 start_codon:yes stop_codon:yes gene_type:complete